MSRWIAILAAALLVCGLGGCAERLGQPYRVKIVLEAEVRGELRTLSQVFEIQHFLCRQSFCAPRPISGDALSFDIGDRGLLVATLDDKLSWLLFSLLDAQRSGLSHPRDTFPMSAEDVRLLDTATGSYAFDARLRFPRWLLLKDRLDPGSGRMLDLYGANERTFRPELRLIRATIARTREPVTRTLGAKLPWLAALGGRRNPIAFEDDERTSSPGEPTHLVREHFVATHD